MSPRPGRTRRPWLVLAGLLAAAGCAPFSADGTDADERPVVSPQAGDGPAPGPGPGSVDAVPAKGVAGRVVARGGRPLGGVFVQAAIDGAGGPVPELAVFSGADGGFAYPLPPGSYILSFMLDGRVIALRGVQVPMGQGIRIEVLVD